MLTFVLVVLDPSDTDVSVGAIEGIGWFFYGAHYVDIVSSTGEHTLPVVSGADFPQLVYTLVPVLVLIGSGFVLARRSEARRGIVDGITAGSTIVVGYLPLAIVGTYVFSDAGSGPDLIASVVFAGIAFPIVFGVVGGIVASQVD